MRELRIEIRNADPAYVEERVGAALYTHLRAVPKNVEFRRDGVDRACRLYAGARNRGDSEARVGGLALLALQRAMLAVEDLGGLLHALEEPPSFARLVSYRFADISNLFDRLLRTPVAVTATYRIATETAIDAEPGLSDEQRRAMKRLRAITLAHLGKQLATVAAFWRALSHPAKKTMHGLGFIAGCYAVEPPGAGSIGALVQPNHPRPFAVVLTTRVDHAARHAHTEVATVELTDRPVRQMHEAGLAACYSMELLAGGWLHGLQTNHAYTLPATYLHELPRGQRLALAPLFDQ